MYTVNLTILVIMLQDYDHLQTRIPKIIIDQCVESAVSGRHHYFVC